MNEQTLVLERGNHLSSTTSFHTEEITITIFVIFDQFASATLVDLQLVI